MNLYFLVMVDLLGGLINVQLFMLQILYRDLLQGGRFEEEREVLESAKVSKLKLKQLENFHYN
jgi:hypothetical protein